MKVGRMHSSSIVHIARGVRTVRDAALMQDRTLYAPLCRSMYRANVAYLGILPGGEEAVTCTRCQAKAAKMAKKERSYDDDLR
jgi:hypothetical protein